MPKIAEVPKTRRMSSIMSVVFVKLSAVLIRDCC
jgi:hypothetical protein